MPPEIPTPFEDEYSSAALFLMRVFAAGGIFKQPRKGPLILLPKLPPVRGVQRNAECPCGSGRKAKRCHPACTW